MSDYFRLHIVPHRTVFDTYIYRCLVFVKLWSYFFHNLQLRKVLLNVSCYVTGPHAIPSALLILPLLICIYPLKHWVRCIRRKLEIELSMIWSICECEILTFLYLLFSYVIVSLIKEKVCYSIVLLMSVITKMDTMGSFSCSLIQRTQIVLNDTFWTSKGLTGFLSFMWYYLPIQKKFIAHVTYVTGRHWFFWCYKILSFEDKMISSFVPYL